MTPARSVVRRVGPRRVRRPRVRLRVEAVELSPPTARWDDPESWAERRLMLAVLEEGIRTLIGAIPTATPWWWRQSYAWVTSTDREQPFGFESVCAELGLDATELRRRVLTAAGIPGAVVRDA